MKTRRWARIAVIQALFEVDLAHHDPAISLRERLRVVSLSALGVEFAQRLLRGVLRCQDGLDLVIQRIAPEWPVAQISAIDRNVLRLAAYEILIDDDTPPKVVINEAVELAKMFGSHSSSRFVNGVLGTLFADKDEFLAFLELPVGLSSAPSDETLEVEFD